MIRKTFLKKDNIIYNVIDGTLNDTGLEEPLTEEDYLEHGMDDLNNVPFDELGHTFEVLTYADFEEEQSLRLIYELPYPAYWRKSLVKKDDVIYTVEDGQLVPTPLMEPLTEEDYLTYGTSLIHTVPVEQLGEQFELLTYTESEVEQSLRLTYGLPYPAFWRKSLVKKDDVIYTVEDGQLVPTPLVEPLTEEDYLTYGTNLIHTVPAEQLGEQFELLTYAESEDPQLAKLDFPESTPLDWLDDPNPILVTYSEGGEPPTLYVTLEVEQKVEFWVSKDEHQTHWVFRDGVWQESDIGMSKEEIEAITPAQWALWFERGTLDFKIRLSGLRVPGETEGPWVESITVTFPENEAPLIKNFLLTPDEFHNEYVELSATIEDQEGDTVYYQVLINDEQVYPVDGEWSPPLESGTKIFLAYNHPYFDVGTNTVTLRVKDDRGKEREQSGEVILLNNPPTITLTHTNFNLHATLGDEDGDDVSYRLLINGKQFYPEGEGFSEPISAPAAIVIPWGSQDLILGEENTLRLEVKDTIGEVTSTEFTVVGQYQGLMFIDEEGNYFTTDQGVILQELDFGPLVAGRTSPVRKLILRNQLGEPVENPEITISHNVPDVAVNISHQEEPFVPQSRLNPPAMGDGDTYEFYVRVHPNKNATTGGSFRISSNTME